MDKRIFGATALVAVGLLVWLARPPRDVAEVAAPREPSGWNVLLISVDTLRPDHLSLYGYERPTTPYLDSFFADAELYERAYTSHSCTPPSAISLVTGLYPSSHGVRKFFRPLAAEVPTLPDRLRGAGYQTAAVVSNFVLRSGSTKLASRFDHYDDINDEAQVTRKKFFERKGSRTTDAALAWLRGERDSERPHFLWVHYMDPHSPYLPPETVVDFTHETPVDFDVERVLWHTRLPGVTDGAEYVDRYDEEIAYTDQQIGRLLDAYADLGLLENTVVVLTADHGENLLEHDRYFEHCNRLWETVMRIPLVVRRPDGQPSKIDVPVSIIDVAPSILQYAGVEPEAPFDGKPFEERSPTDLIFLETVGNMTHSDRRAVVQGDSKWGVLISDGEVTDRWYFDLARDPQEDGPPSWTEGDAWRIFVERLEGELGIEMEQDDEVQLSDKELEALRALGYVE